MGLHSWVVLGEPLAVELGNTLFATTAGCRDGLATPSALQSWARAHDFEVGLPSQAEWEASVRLRDALRACFAAVAESEIPPVEAVAVLNDVSRSHRIAPVLEWTTRGPRAHRDAGLQPVGAMLGECARSAIELLGSEEHRRIKACARPPCPLFFVRTHPRRTWCSNYCGDLMRQARHYRRTRAKQPGTPDSASTQST